MEIFRAVGVGGDAIVNIRDFRHAPYATESAELLTHDSLGGVDAA